MQPDTQNPQPGGFMTTAGAGQPGQGGALLRLMQLRGSINASPQQGNNVPLPAAQMQSGSPINMQSMQQAGQQMQQPQVAAQPQPAQAPQTSFTGEDPNLQIALGALSNYVKAHGESHMAEHGVHMAKANAKVREAQAPQNPPASQVGGQ